MIVYTIQHIKVLEKIQKQGKVFADKRFICDSSFKAAYQWYLTEAKINCPQWENDRPFWVWVKRPNLRYWKYFKDPRRKEREELALIELEVPDSLILLSDFMFWHFVLNKIYLSYSEQDEAAFDLKAKNRTYEELPPSLKQQVQTSWRRCLKLNENSFSKFDNSFLDTEQIFQGIIPFLHKSQIKSIKYFTAYNLKS